MQPCLHGLCCILWWWGNYGGSFKVKENLFLYSHWIVAMSVLESGIGLGYNSDIDSTPLTLPVLTGDFFADPSQGYPPVLSPTLYSNQHPKHRGTCVQNILQIKGVFPSTQHEVQQHFNEKASQDAPLTWRENFSGWLITERSIFFYCLPYLRL